MPRFTSSPSGPRPLAVPTPTAGVAPWHCAEWCANKWSQPGTFPEYQNCMDTCRGNHRDRTLTGLPPSGGTPSRPTTRPLMMRNPNPACGPAKPPAVFPRGPTRSMSPVPVPQGPPGKFMSPVPVPQGPPGKFMSPVPAPLPPPKVPTPAPLPYAARPSAPLPPPHVPTPAPLPYAARPSAPLPPPKVPTPAPLPFAARAPNPPQQGGVSCPTGYELRCWHEEQVHEGDVLICSCQNSEGDITTPTVGPDPSRPQPVRPIAQAAPLRRRGTFGSIQPQRPVPPRRDPVLTRMAARRGMLPA